MLAVSWQAKNWYKETNHHGGSTNCPPLSCWAGRAHSPYFSTWKATSLEHMQEARGMTKRRRNPGCCKAKSLKLASATGDAKGRIAKMPGIHRDKAVYWALGMVSSQDLLHLLQTELHEATAWDLTIQVPGWWNNMAAASLSKPSHLYLVIHSAQSISMQHIGNR